VILAYSKAFHKKPIPENRMQDRLWNECLHFITKEVWPESYILCWSDKTVMCI